MVAFGFVLLTSALAAARPSDPDWVLIGTSVSNADHSVDRASVKVEGDIRTFAEMTSPRSVEMRIVEHQRVDCVKMTSLTLDMSIDGRPSSLPSETVPKALVEGSLGWVEAKLVCSWPAS